MENDKIRVRKRSGDVVDFDISKISSALRKAFDSMQKPISEDALEMIALRVLSVADDKVKDGILGVEDIQNAAEIVLIQTGFVDVAKAYMEYRQKHQEARDVRKTELNYAKLVDDYLGQDDWRVKENSTVTYTLGGLILSNSGAVTANYWLSQVYDKEIADAHRNADIHIHDLSMLSPYCAGWSLKQLIKEGLGGVQGRISSSPASHLSTLCNQMVNFLGCTQNEWAGAQAFSSFDTYLAPFVKIDNLSYKETKQAIQSFVFGVNTPSRWGCQAPFTNVTIDWTMPDDLKNLKAIVGGKEADFTYGDCKKEMDMVNKAFLEIFLEGDANGRGFQYPIPTYSITKDFDWSETENNKLLFDLTAKYGTPYFSNYVNSSMNPSDVRSMCCRLRLDLRELRKKNGGFFGAGESTGCYDEKTYVFTNHGWKLFKDVDDNDEVCTLSPANEIEFHKPDKKFVYDYDGEMVKISGEKIDLLVTPNHRMLYCDRYTDEHKFVRADSITRENYKIPASGHWTGKDSEFFVLPGIDTEFRTGEYDNLHKIEWEPVKIKMTSWLKFLGMFISEGSFDNDECAATHGYRVFISQVKEETKAIFDEALKELPFNYSYDGRAFVICNKQLWSYVRQFGLCYDKFIPDDIKELPSEKLKVLYDFLMYGDGSIRRKIESKRPNAIHQKVYYTVSEKLANDVREILIKIGCMSSVNVRQGRISEIKGRVITSASKQYEVCAYQGKNRYLTKRNIGKEKYTGKVYCCEVQNNTLLVKRNEKMCWCGNSIGVVTINMPRIGYLSKDKEDFYKRLDHMMDVCARSLEMKRKVVTDLYDRGLYPYTKRYLGDIGYKNHFSTIGLVGMNEACLNANWLRCDLTHKEAQDFTEEVINHMRNRLSDYQEQYPGTLFNLEATPAESTAYRLAKHDKETYPDIITAGKPGETPYYTNSSHLPVGYTADIFSALDVEDRFQTLYTSGTVFHAFLGQRLPNWQSCMKLVRKIAENYKLPYYTMSPTYSVCPEHGYLEGEQWKCPYCGKETEVYSRITGYYRPVKNWNAGKAQEFHDRTTYVVGDNAKTEEKHSGCDGSCEFGNSGFKADPKPGKVDHVMIFTSPTCPNCKMAKMLLDKAGIEYENIDAASNKELTTSFGITKAPTMLVPDGDNFDVYDNASQIAGWIKERKTA